MAHRDRASLGLPQALANHIPALHCRVIGVGFLDLSLLFLFGHGWREGGERKGEGGVIQNYMKLEVDDPKERYPYTARTVCSRRS